MTAQRSCHARPTVLAALIALLPLLSLWLLVCPAAPAVGAEPATYQSHAPMRPLPTASHRPLPDGPVYFADGQHGDDANPGTKGKPWRTIAHGLARLRPGDTLCLRAGVYYEPCTIAVHGSADKPITLRSYPGELVVVDAGLRDFYEQPAKAWAPLAGGAGGEFISTQSYAGLEKVFGNFADSMIPLHGYRLLGDLRSDNEYWNGGGKLDADWSIYCGPGLWYDQQSGRVHCRLKHTTLAALGPDNYRGQTDPRKLRLIVTAAPDCLHLRQAEHLRVYDLVLRGARRSALNIEFCQDVEVAGVTAYGTDPVVNLRGNAGLRLLHCDVRGIASPWSFRASHKYRGTAAYLLVARGDDAANRDVEIAHCRLTDSHDGPFIGTVRGLKFHHNLVDNFNDDGVYLTAMSLGGDVHIYQNVISRCLHAFSFFGEYPAGGGVWIYRNVIDLRAPVHYGIPNGPNDPGFTPRGAGQRYRFPSAGALCGDHGSPTWEPIHFYQNTVIARDRAFRDYYGLGWGGHLARTQRWVYNNIFVQLDGWPGLNVVPAGYPDLHMGSNLQFGLRGDRPAPKAGAATPMGDRWADPLFKGAIDEGAALLDLPLRAQSPAVDAGAVLDAAWPDPLRDADRGAPDLGAVPLGAGAEVIGPGPRQ